MSYPEALDFLYSQLPMYSRIGKAAYKADLNNTIQLCELLDHPENKFKSIHIAGTNGKGSVSHMLAAILQTAGYKTGLYTSPHLKDFRERIRINGEMISQEEVTEFVDRYKDEVIKIGCSFFEWTVGLAFDHFSKHQVDIAVIETGMGGRLDSTNVITPLLSIITNISWDHTDILGDTLEKIAVEKAGIIKENIPVIIGETDQITEPIFKNYAAEKKADIFFADQFFMIKKFNPFTKTKSILRQKKAVVEEKDSGKEYQFDLDLPGIYQEKNILTVLESIVELRKLGLKIPDEKVYKALSSVKSITGLRGRWDIISKNPTVIADVAHNEAGLKFSVQQLSSYSYDNLHFVLGFVKEKDLSKILPLFPMDAFYYFCSPAIERGLAADSLQRMAQENNLNGRAYPSVSKALEAAKFRAGADDVIYVGGSTFVIAEVI